MVPEIVETLELHWKSMEIHYFLKMIWKCICFHCVFKQFFRLDNVFLIFLGYILSSGHLMIFNYSRWGKRPGESPGNPFAKPKMPVGASTYTVNLESKNPVRSWMYDDIIYIYLYDYNIWYTMSPPKPWKIKVFWPLNNLIYNKHLETCTFWGAHGIHI